MNTAEPIIFRENRICISVQKTSQLISLKWSKRMEAVGVLIALAVALYILQGLWNSITRPKSGDSFTCSTCGVQARHSSRTISAWKSGLKRSVCNQCHAQFMNAQASSSRGGCFGVIAFATLIPTLTALTVMILFVYV
jgi:hypothetical protein